MIRDEYRIPDNWHSLPAYNCLTNEQFRELQETHNIGDGFIVECDECGEYYLTEYHRCDCGNRRCHLSYENGQFVCEVW